MNSARGGMGAVFEAEQIETGRRVALKLLNHQLDSPEARARFLREGRLAASVNHPNSVYVFSTEEIGDMAAIAMEMVGGGTLEECVKENGPLPIGEAVDAILQIISGLEAAQEIGILHRDIKPGNCFQDSDGTIKEGDFGLSISTDARDEKHLTMEGTIFGTPAFASPEQLRGDELNVRSDIYAVGTTLFYLLTGRPAFTGKSVAQLFANVLEGKTPSPRELRPEIPIGLANVVLRCLQKIPTDRYRSYAELRKALVQYSSEADVAAPLPLRLAAGVIDWFLYMMVILAVQFSLFGGPFFANPNDIGPALTIGIVIALTFWALYYSLMEGLLGYTVGKGICRLRVVQEKGGPPGIPKAAIRAFLAILLPSLPVWIYSSQDPIAFSSGPTTAVNVFFMTSFYLILALLFSTARKRNGFAAVFDLLTKTRVIRSKTYEDRPVAETEILDPVTATEETPKIGPYHVLEVFEKGEDVEWLVAYDSRLLRKIWIRKMPVGREPVFSSHRQLGRAGRLRWLAGRRSDEENWDAYEFPGGQSLANLLRKESSSWSTVRYWLLDLAEEMRIAESEGSLPEVLSLERIWITGGGRAKLLDFTAPGISAENGETHRATPVELLEDVAALAREPLPLHASSFRENLSLYPDLSTIVEALKLLLHRVISVTRARRAVLAAGCVIFPIVNSLLMMFGAQMMIAWQKQQPDIIAINQVLSFRKMSDSRWMRGQEFSEDKLFEIFIAQHFGDTISDPEQWNTPMARSILSPELRNFAEQSLDKHPNPTSEEITQAEEAIGPIAKVTGQSPFHEQWFPLVAAGSGLLLYVCLPAILASVICRGGLVMLACGVVVAKQSGPRASRGRCFWRSLVTWSPWLLAPICIVLLQPALGFGWSSAIVVGIALLLGIASLCLPRRSLQDRIAGTCLAPR